jgi:hypothetical protein
MPDIFRERSLEKLSSTEQLDGMIPMIRPSFWLVLAGAVLAVAASVLWGLFSSLPVCVDAQGVVSQDGRTVLCCVPLEDGKQVQEGMTVTLQTTAGERQAYDTTSAKVVWVEPYVSSQEDLENWLGENEIASYFLADGPVLAVECSLNEAEEEFLPGTLLDCSIVVEEKAPLSFLLPSLFNAPSGGEG